MSSDTASITQEELKELVRFADYVADLVRSAENRSDRLVMDLEHAIRHFRIREITTRALYPGGDLIDRMQK